MTKLLKTYYINCKNNNQNAEIGKSYIQRLSRDDYHAYARYIESLTNIFYYAQALYEDGIKTTLYATLIIHKNEYFKTQDPETNFDRIDFLVNNFKEPGNPIILSVYERETSEISTPWSMDTIWSTKRQHNPNDTEDYVTIQKLETLKFKRDAVPRRGDNFRASENRNVFDAYDRVIDTLKSYDINFVEIDYTKKISYVYEKLLKARFHISYPGATYYFAALTNTPTLAYGPKYTPNNTDDVIIIDGKNKGLRTRWGNCARPTANKIIHYRNNNLYKSKQEYINNIGQLQKDNEIRILKDALHKHFF